MKKLFLLFLYSISILKSMEQNQQHERSITPSAPVSSIKTYTNHREVLQNKRYVATFQDNSLLLMDTNDNPTNRVIGQISSVLLALNTRETARLISGTSFHEYLKFAHKIKSFSISPNEKYIAIITEDQKNEVLLYKMGSIEPHISIKSNLLSGITQRCIFSPNNELLATLDFYHSFQIWQVTTGKCIFAEQGRKFLGFIPNSNSILLKYMNSDSTNSLEVWDIQNRIPTKIIQEDTRFHEQRLLYKYKWRLFSYK